MNDFAKANQRVEQLLDEEMSKHVDLTDDWVVAVVERLTPEEISALAFARVHAAMHKRLDMINVEAEIAEAEVRFWEMAADLSLTDSIGGSEFQQRVERGEISAEVAEALMLRAAEAAPAGSDTRLPRSLDELLGREPREES